MVLKRKPKIKNKRKGNFFYFAGTKGNKRFFEKINMDSNSIDEGIKELEKKLLSLDIKKFYNC